MDISLLLGHTVKNVRYRISRYEALWTTDSDIRQRNYETMKTKGSSILRLQATTRVADPDPGSSAFSTPWILDPELEKIRIRDPR